MRWMHHLVFPMLLAASGCARIYRPVTLAAPVPAAQNADLAGGLAIQPWGDNSRYEARAREAHLRVAVLSVENRSGTDLELLDLEPAEGSARIPAETAWGLVRQRIGTYVILPLFPVLLAAGASSKGSMGPSDQTLFLAVAMVGACIGIPNAVVASRSNRRLAAFFKDAAWAPGILRSGGTSRGLVFLRSPDPGEPLFLNVTYRLGGQERRLRLLCPGSTYGGRSGQR